MASYVKHSLIDSEKILESKMENMEANNLSDEIDIFPDGVGDILGGGPIDISSSSDDGRFPNTGIAQTKMQLKSAEKDYQEKMMKAMLASGKTFVDAEGYREL